MHALSAICSYSYSAAVFCKFTICSIEFIIIIIVVIIIYTYR